MILVLGLTVAAYILCLSSADLVFIALHLARGRHQLAREKAQLSVPLPVPAERQKVCIQVPVHNEAELVGQAIDALCQIDWPKDDLEIIVLDDHSIDKTREVAARHIAAWRASGVQVRVHSRTIRFDYKAGILQQGLDLTDAPYIVLFDVDCRPGPTVLRQLMPVILSDRKLAFVQARLDHGNRARNWLTRAQALELDLFYAYEQVAKSWLGVPVPSSGSQVIWRREAIEDAGGWRGETLSEDTHLSFRAFLRGWRGRLLATVSVEGELPASFHALQLQRDRWLTGTAQQLRAWPSGLRRQLTCGQYSLFLTSYLFHSTIRFSLVLLLALTALCWGLDPAKGAILAGASAVDVALIVLFKTTGAFLATRLLGFGRKRQWLPDLVLMWGLQLALLPTGGKAMLKGLIARRHEFRRTPKGNR